MEEATKDAFGILEKMDPNYLPPDTNNINLEGLQAQKREVPKKKTLPTGPEFSFMDLVNSAHEPDFGADLLKFNPTMDMGTTEPIHSKMRKQFVSVGDSVGKDQSSSFHI